MKRWYITLVSGHVSKDDLRQAIEKIDPDIVIPVHTESPDWFVENFDRVNILKDGDCIRY